MNWKGLRELIEGKDEIIGITSDGKVEVKDLSRLSSELIDKLVYNAVFSEDLYLKQTCSWLIRTIAQEIGIIPSSIQSLYEARGKGLCSGFSVPAINIRGLTYDVARTVWRAALKNKVKAVIFEIARSEIDYTRQRPLEYTTVILASAIKEGYKGPVFLQGDHFQFPAKKFRENREKEINAIKELIKEAIEAGFYNIDIDSSTLVDLEKPTLIEQQEDNYTMAALMTEYIRRLEPEGITISVGGEIGEVGGKNSTPEDLRAFMEGYNRKLTDGRKGISKISIQTGTSHGGVVLPDGSIAKVKIDFDALKSLSKIAREEYGMAGAVQHGASTLPDEAFHKFPEVETAEVHLATGFQNIIYDHPQIPEEFRQEVYEFLKNEFKSEWKEGQTEEQFIYKTRKKGFGPFKKKFWDLPEDVRSAISKTLEDKFEFLFKQLNVVNTDELVDKFITPVKVEVLLSEEVVQFLEGKEPLTKKVVEEKGPESEYHPDELGE